MTNPITITMDMERFLIGTLITGEVASSHPKIRRVTLWFFAPGIRPNAAQTWNDLKALRIKAMSQSLHPLPATFRKRSSRKAPGIYTAVAHVPAEPGSVGGDTVAATTFELVA